jgi:hypothetical protein
MKRFLNIAIIGLMILLTIILLVKPWNIFSNSNVVATGRQSDATAIVQSTAKSPLPDRINGREHVLALVGGQEHAQAFAQLLDWIKNQQLLTPEDRDALLAYLTQPQPPALSSGEWEERVNEILNLLRTQQGGVPGLSELMLHMAEQDPNPVLRMYALQHIAMWIPDEPTPEKREAMVKYLQQLLQRPNDPLAGSALLFLTDLEHTGQIQRSAETDAQFQTAALNLITNPKTRPDVKISVLHACVDRKQNDILPTARTIAADETLMIPLRKAAIHSIARMGTIEDIPLLESLAAGNKDLKAATTPALEKLMRVERK